MMIRSRQSHQEKVANASSSSNQETKIESFLLSLLILFIPSQLGKHFWPDFAIVSGIRVDYLSPTLYLTDLFVVLLFGCWLFRQRHLLRIKNFHIKHFSTVVLLLLLGIILSGNYLNGLYHLLKFLEFSFVAFYVATTVTKLSQLAKMLVLLSVGVIFESVLATLQFVQQGALGGIFYFLGERYFTASTPGIANASISGELLLRPYGTFAHPNVLAGYLLCAMLLILFLSPSKRVARSEGLPIARMSIMRRARWEGGRDRTRVIHILALLLGTAGIILSLSRVAMVLWGVLLVIIFVTQMKVFFSKLSKLWIALFVVVLSLFFVGFTNTPFAGRLLQSNFDEEAVVQRVALLEASTALFLKQPVLGVGLGNFLPQLKTVQQPLASGMYLQPVHNIFLLVLAETGLTGLGFFVWFLWRTYRRLFLVIRQDSNPHSVYRVFLVVLTVALILGSVDHYFLTLQQGQLLFSFLLGLAWVRLRG